MGTSSKLRTEPAVCADQSASAGGPTPEGGVPKAKHPPHPPAPAPQAAKSAWRTFRKPRAVSEKEPVGKNTPDVTQVLTKQCSTETKTSWT